MLVSFSSEAMAGRVLAALRDTPFGGAVVEAAGHRALEDRIERFGATWTGCAASATGHAARWRRRVG